MSEKYYKKIYTTKEFYDVLYKAMRTLKYLLKCKKNNLLKRDFIERIMLAVTEVNGCEMCSYGHTKMALEQGMSSDEIQKILSGNTEDVSSEEAVAVFFGQHYADTRGNPSKESWQRLDKEYGQTKSLGILGAIRIMMIGNIQGMALGALLSRMKGKPIEKSNLGYEIKMILSQIIFFPIAFIHSMISSFLKKPII